MKRILYIALFEIFEIVDGMSIPVTICNDTTQPVIVKNFDLKRSSVNIYIQLVRYRPIHPLVFPLFL